MKVMLNKKDVVYSSVENIMKNNKLGLILNPESDDTNPVLGKLIQILNEEDVDEDLNVKVVFTTSQFVQAGLIYGENVIFVSKGLIASLCRLSDAIVDNIPYSDEKNNITLISLVDYYGIKSEFEKGDIGKGRNALIFCLVKTMFDFIYNHECGHFLNNHGIAARKNLEVEVDHKSSVLSPEEAISLQAKELVADERAAINFKIYANSNITDALGLHHVLHDSVADILTLTSIYAYFRMMHKYMHTSHYSSCSHPSWSLRALWFSHVFSRTTRKEKMGFFTQEALYSLQIVKDVFDQFDNGSDDAWIFEYEDDAYGEWITKVTEKTLDWYSL